MGGKTISDWDCFENYISTVPSADPDLDVNDLGIFALTKAVQTHVLIKAYKTVAGAGDVPQECEIGLLRNLDRNLQWLG